MSRLKSFIQHINEMVYKGNMGAIEMITFFQKASSKEIKMMEKVVKSEDWEEYKILIKKVLGIKLK